MPTCSQCKIEKIDTEFFKDRSRKNGLGRFCKECQLIYVRTWKQQHAKEVNEDNRSRYWRNIDESRRRQREHYRDKILPKLITAARSRAKRKNLPFSISTNDLVVPMYCPILGIRMCVASGSLENNSPTIDRIDSRKGYVPGNVAVISHLANQIKSCGTADQHRKIANWMDEKLTGGV